MLGTRSTWFVSITSVITRSPGDGTRRRFAQPSPPAPGTCRGVRGLNAPPRAGDARAVSLHGLAMIVELLLALAGRAGDMTSSGRRFRTSPIPDHGVPGWKSGP